MKIVLSAVLALFLLGCSEDSPKEVQNTEVKQVVAQEVKAEAPKAIAAKEDVVAEITKEVETVVTQAVEETKVAAVAAVAEVKQEVVKVVEVATVKEEAAKETEVKVEAVKEEVAGATSSNGEAIYKVCSSCHGANAEKAALGKSQVIKGWSADKVESALNGYKDGTYGGTMKALMKGQASKLSPEDIKAVSDYISKL